MAAFGGGKIHEMGIKNSQNRKKGYQPWEKQAKNHPKGVETGQKRGINAQTNHQPSHTELKPPAGIAQKQDCFAHPRRGRVKWWVVGNSKLIGHYLLFPTRRWR
jgi:hypothetical protein